MNAVQNHIKNPMQPTHDFSCEGRETRCERQCEGQNPRQYWHVKSVNSKTAPACARYVQQNRCQSTAAKNLHASTNALNAFNTLHTPVNKRLCDVKGNFFALHTLHMTTKPTEKPLRQTMPTVAAWIDELRDVFGADQINPSIKAGIDGQPTFWARENGQEIGTKAVYDPDRTVSLADVSIGPFRPAERRTGR